MLFNSIGFAIFLPIVFILYWFATKGKLRLQNSLLLVSSYFFYAWWDWRFLFLLISLSIINYLIGIRLDKDETGKTREIWLVLGLLVNLGVLCVFKYYNFFINSFIDLISLFGYNLSRSTTKIILPLGISFYTFLSLSYLLDIYKKNLKAHRNIIEVLLTLSFFPIIFAGPIQRPVSLLPQITKKREFNYDQVADGLRQILWGLFAKVVIADNLAIYADNCFLNYSNYSGSTLLLGALFYTIQIYADFSGYSDMAIGIAKLFGFSLMRNFAYPYFSRDITEFWKRWHISLVTWFRDYLFLPLSFAISWRIRGEKILLMRTDLFIYVVASAVVWFLTGLWHGANYTFIIWGMIHGFFLIVYHVQRNPRKKFFNKIGITNDHIAIKIFEAIITLCIVMMAWIFFRSENIEHAINYLSGLFSPSLISMPHFTGMSIELIKTARTTVILAIIFMLIEWHGREQQFAIARLGLKWKQPIRYAMYYAIIIVIFWFGSKEQQFIYFKF